MNVNGSNAPAKRHRLAEWIQKQDSYINICAVCLQETHFRPKGTCGLKLRGWNKQKKAGLAILISDKTGLKIKMIARYKEGHYTMIIGLIQEKDITSVNIYSRNIVAPQYIRKALTDIKGEVATIIVGDFRL